MYRPTYAEVPHDSDFLWGRRRAVTTSVPAEPDPDPETLNEVLNQMSIDEPLSSLAREQLGLRPLTPGVEQWRPGSTAWGMDGPTEQELENGARWDEEPDVWGAPVGGDWGVVEERELGVLSLVRAQSDGQADGVQVAVRLAGHSVARIGWDYMNEVLVSIPIPTELLRKQCEVLIYHQLPFPSNFGDAEGWPAMPGELELTNWALSDDAERMFHQFGQICTWFTQAHPEDHVQPMSELWSSLWEVIVAQTDPGNRPGDEAACRVLEHARAILPVSTQDIEDYFRRTEPMYVHHSRRFGNASFVRTLMHGADLIAVSYGVPIKRFPRDRTHHIQHCGGTISVRCNDSE